MTFGDFITRLSLGLGVPESTGRNLVLGFRDETLALLAAGDEIAIPGLGRFRSATSRRRVCVSNLPGRISTRSVTSRRRLKFSAYSSAEERVGELRARIASGIVAHPIDRRIVMAKKRGAAKRRRSVEVSVPSDVSEITIKIDEETEKKSEKKSESTSRRKLLG